MSWLDAALLFIVVCNLAFVVGAAFLLYRMADAAESSRLDLQKAAKQNVEATEKLYLVAKRTLDEMGQVNDAQADRERSATRGVVELAAQVKSLTERLKVQAVMPEITSTDEGTSPPITEEFQFKLRAELNAAVAKNHQLQEEIHQTQFRLKEAMAANRELRGEVGEVKGVKQSVVDKLTQRANELETQLQHAQDRARAAEVLAETNAMKLDEIKEQLTSQQVIAQAEIDQSGLIQSQQEQIDMLAAREKALMARMDQMEQTLLRNQAEKSFIEERFLQLDSGQSSDGAAVSAT